MKTPVFILGVLVSLAYAQNHDRIVGCYWGAWSFYRDGFGKFDVDDIDPNLCTHGYYGFADLDNATWTLKVIDPWYDLGPQDCPLGDAECHYDSYRRFIGLKKQSSNFKPMISIGGWNAGSGAYSDMAADPIKRKTFVESVAEFLDKFDFDGVDLDWEYPGQREGADPEHDKENFSRLVEEMSAMLKPRGKIFSAALSPAKKTVESAYDLPFIIQHFDFLNVMTYDYHGWFPDHFFTGHNAPLYRREEEEPEDSPGWYFNVFDTIQVYLDGGVPANQIVMGMPTYGRGFVLNNTEENGLYCGAHAGIPKGPYTRQKGIWGHQEILQAFNNDTLINLPDAKPGDWKVVVDDCYRAPYAYNGPYWIGYDNEESFKIKAQFINFLDLAGAMIWSIDTDDHRGDYAAQRFPMLHTIHDTLETDEKYDPENPMCTGSAPICPDLLPTTTEPPTEPPTTMMTTTSTTMTPTTTADPGPYECSAPNDVIPFPGDCHKYFMCLANANGGYDLQEFTCGDWVFDPHIDACTDPALPSNDNLCNE